MWPRDIANHSPEFKTKNEKPVCLSIRSDFLVNSKIINLITSIYIPTTPKYDMDDS